SEGGRAAATGCIPGTLTDVTAFFSDRRRRGATTALMVQENRRMTNEKQPPTSMSRRTFMGTAAAAAGITILPRHVLGAGFQAPSDTVNRSEERRVGKECRS